MIKCEPVKTIRALYRANRSTNVSKPIRPGNFPEGYFMNISPLDKNYVKQPTFMENIRNIFKLIGKFIKNI